MLRGSDLYAVPGMVVPGRTLWVRRASPAPSRKERGREVLASVDCTGPRVLPGEVARLRCGLGDKARAYDTVTVRDLL